MNPVCTQVPRELLEHAYDHLSKGDGFDCRIAFISVDNAVEVMAKTFLSLGDSRQKGDSLASDEPKIDKSIPFPKLLQLLNKAASDRIVGLNMEETRHFHSIRNNLYHTFGLSVERSVVEAYAQIAKALYENLFERSLRIDRKDENVGEVGKFISEWNALQEVLAAKLPARAKGDQTVIVKFFSQINPDLAGLYQRVLSFRNALIHDSSLQSSENVREHLNNITRLLAASESEERVPNASGRQSRNTKWSTQLNLEELRDQAKMFFERQLREPVRQVKPNLFETNDGCIGIRYSVSRAYPSGNQTQFWFALHDAQIDFLKSHIQGWVAFVCAGAGVLYAPWNEFQAYIEDLGETSADSGHWRHVILRRNPEGRIQMKLRGSGPQSKVDVSRWFLGRWPLVG